ncbi:hypothetical protein L218DRAFT_988282, partial [Marasmius fiardii PR-910]
GLVVDCRVSAPVSVCLLPALHHTIAVYQNVRWWSWKGCLRFAGRTDSVTRFLLTDHGYYIEVDSDSESFSWLSQALHVCHVHNISFDEDLLHLNTCNYLGLPINLVIRSGYDQWSWHTKVYKALHNFQVARGFNPTTTDFAQSLEFPIFEVVPPKNQFQEVDFEGDKQILHLPNQFKDSLAH